MSRKKSPDKRRKGLSRAAFVGSGSVGNEPSGPANRGAPRWPRWPTALFVGLACLLAAGGGLEFAIKGKGGSRVLHEAKQGHVSRPAGSLSFTRDVAPIVFKNCAACHRPGQAAPFSLLTYQEVKKHARQIAEVTARRYMPPWPPEHGYGEFAEERRLSDEQIGILQQWVAEGAAEGDPALLPPTPHWDSDWQLGPPDLVVTVPQAYTLRAEGKDVYRNLVIPIPVADTRYVRAVEFRPGNLRVVHHAFIDIDESRQSRRLAAKENPPGFDGMELPESAIMPSGQLLGWQPGKAVSSSPQGLSWILHPNTDLVLQLHLHPSGKPEAVQPSVGFYFTDQAPTNFPYRLRLVSYDFNIPPGDDHYVVEESYVLPVDLDFLRVNPHAHYLGKDLEGYALLPNGNKQWLLWIKDWDFNWQGDYGYARPVSLPKGTKVVMHYVYDNSTNNVRNPNQPPKLVRHGLNTTDEMAALGFQVLAHNAEDRDFLVKDYLAHLEGLLRNYCVFALRLNPQDDMAHTRLARFLLAEGKWDEAASHLARALALNPRNDQAHYTLGYAYLQQHRAAEAVREFQTVIRLNPEDSQAYGNLGLIMFQERRFEAAQAFLESALRLNPQDAVAQKNLDLVKLCLSRR